MVEERQDLRVTWCLCGHLAIILVPLLGDCRPRHIPCLHLHHRSWCTSAGAMAGSSYSVFFVGHGESGVPRQVHHLSTALHKCCSVAPSPCWCGCIPNVLLTHHDLSLFYTRMGISTIKVLACNSEIAALPLCLSSPTHPPPRPSGQAFHIILLSDETFSWTVPFWSVTHSPPFPSDYHSRMPIIHMLCGKGNKKSMDIIASKHYHYYIRYWSSWK